MKYTNRLPVFLKTCRIFIWEAPQSLLGFLIYLMKRRSSGKPEKWHCRALIPAKGFGISLGWFIFYPVPDHRGKRTDLRSMKHEVGHALQSQWLGPLYLLVVGIPSLARILYSKLYFKIHRKSWDGYYLGYPERWADRLGNRLF